MKPIFGLLATLLITISLPAMAERTERHYLYGAIGVMDFDDDDVAELTDDTGTDYDGDLGNRPYGGGFVQFPLNRASQDGPGQWGYEAGGYVSWKNHTSSFEAKDNTARIRIENEFLMVETFLGLFTALQLGDRVRLSASVGPTFVYGRVSLDDDTPEIEPYGGGSNIVINRDSSDSDVTLAAYARAGIDIRISERSYIGLSVKTIKGELEFDDSIGEVDLEGPYVMVTFGKRIN
jgi:hypothetical protein